MLLKVELLMVIAAVPLAMLFYRQLRRRNPSQAPVWHFAKAVLASFALVLLVGLAISVLWPETLQF